MEDQPSFSLAFVLPASSQANKSNENEAQQARFLNLSEQELEKILAERHSARTKKTTNWCDLWQLLKVNINVMSCFFFVTFVKPTENQF